MLPIVRQNENDESGFAGWVKSVRNGKIKNERGIRVGISVCGCLPVCVGKRKGTFCSLALSLCSVHE